MGGNSVKQIDNGQTSTQIVHHHRHQIIRLTVFDVSEGHSNPMQPDVAHHARAVPHASVRHRINDHTAFHVALCARLLEICQLSWRTLVVTPDQGFLEALSMPAMWLCHYYLDEGSCHNMTTQHSEMLCLMKCAQF